MDVKDEEDGGVREVESGVYIGLSSRGKRKR